MPFSGTVFSNVSGASSAAPGQTIQSAVWDAIHVDYAAALTQLNSQYASVNTNRNIAWMNGGFEVFQRGAGNTFSLPIGANATGTYGPDRWYIGNGASQACTVAAAPGLSSGSNNSAKLSRNSGQSGTSRIYMCYPFDTDECARMRGKYVYLNVLVKTGSNFSASNFKVEFITGTGSPTRQLVNPYYSANPISIVNSAVVGNTYQVTGQSSAAVLTTTNQAELQISWVPTGTAGADDSLTIDDVSLEVVTSSSTWTPMNYDRTPFTQMLEACKRHYQKSFSYSVAPAFNRGSVGGYGQFSFDFGGPIIGYVGNSTNELFPVTLPVELRSAPVSYQLYNPVKTSNTFLCMSTVVSVAEGFPGTIYNAGAKGFTLLTAQVTTVNTGPMLYLCCDYIVDASIQ